MGAAAAGPLGRPRAPLPRNRAGERLLRPEADASYGIDFDDFAKQMTMIAHAGYQTIDLETFLALRAGGRGRRCPRGRSCSPSTTPERTRGPAATASSQKLGFNAVMFVDVGRVDDGNPEYLTWDELETVEGSGRWELQLHSGDGHRQIQYGPGPERRRPLLRVPGAGRGLRRLAEAGALRHRLGRGHARRPRPRLPPARLRAPVRQLRPGRHQRPTHPRGSPRLADAALRRSSSPRTGTRGRTGAADSRSAGSRSRERSRGGDLHAKLLSGGPRKRRARSAGRRSERDSGAGADADPAVEASTSLGRAGRAGRRARSRRRRRSRSCAIAWSSPERPPCCDLDHAETRGAAGRGVRVAGERQQAPERGEDWLPSGESASRSGEGSSLSVPTNENSLTT